MADFVCFQEAKKKKNIYIYIKHFSLQKFGTKVAVFLKNHIFIVLTNNIFLSVIY